MHSRTIFFIFLTWGIHSFWVPGSFEMIQTRVPEQNVRARWASAVYGGLWNAGGPRRLHPLRTNQTQRTSQQRQSRCLFPVLGSWVFQSISHAPDVTKASFFETIWLKIMRLSLLLWAQGEKNINTSWSRFSLKLIKLKPQGLSLSEFFLGPCS